MKRGDTSAVGLFFLPLALLACSLGSSSGGTGPEDTPEASSGDPATATRPADPALSASPTTERPQLEILQSQAWTDRFGNPRVNVLFHNPYDYPVNFRSRPRASLYNAAGEFVRDDELYFLDGISGGSGFLLPGETIAANGCFTCEEAPLSGEWASVEFVAVIQDATGSWNTSTEVEASGLSVSFEDEGPLFFVSGTVKNSSAETLDRISVRVFVYNQEGVLVGVAEASGYDVGAGASAAITGTGFGQRPDGPYTFEFTVLGVSY